MLNHLTSEASFMK